MRTHNTNDYKPHPLSKGGLFLLVFQKETISTNLASLHCDSSTLCRTSDSGRLGVINFDDSSIIQPFSLITIYR